MYFHSNIKYLRNQIAMSEEDVARLVGISSPDYMAMEKWNAEPKLVVLVKISEVFNVGLHSLICENLSKD